MDVSWVWVYCTDYLCGHSRAMPYMPWMIRWWDSDHVGEKMARNFVCSMCGKRGANFSHPGIDHDTRVANPFPAQPVRIGGRRRIPESCNAAEIRCRAEYLARYPSGDALSEFQGGPPGPAQMCGKFTAMASWGEVVAFSQPLTREDVKESDNDRIITFRVMSNLPVIIWDAASQSRKVVPMRWGWPHPKDWKIPQPIHACAESIDDPKKSFLRCVTAGQRGIVLVRTFNEAPDVPGPTVQHTITPGDASVIAIALVWKQFELADLPGSLRACVMVTVPANQLIATLPTDRMPAVLADVDWSTWLGEVPADMDALKACLKTVEGVRWTMNKEERAAKTKRGKPTVSDPTGLL
jgi:putative SOS response-associated peptidase YedK